ncbi:MAG: YicC family protein [Bacteroidales bacterium]|nr:YicC family protein [Bacteroidales bacterium]
MIRKIPEMIKSMTGYGKAEAILPTGKLTIEIKTLNGKNSDANIKTQLLPKDKELLVRQMIAESLVRGTIDFFMTWEPGAGSAKQVNPELVKEYFNQMKEIRNSLTSYRAANFGDQARMDNMMLTSIMRFPDVLDNSRQDVVTEENWPLVEKAISVALQAVNDYRDKEGEALYKDVTSRVRGIMELEDEVEKLEPERVATVKERLMKNLAELEQKVDPSRFEQEMIFYLEKLDINEEKVRLRQHCKYFLDTIDSEPCPGKKLGFIIQEMGREINTTGSKANHAGIQNIVVRMKDELEKIREQSMNIL